MDIRLRLVEAADWLEAHLLRHRIYRVCHWIAASSWWGPDHPVAD